MKRISLAAMLFLLMPAGAFGWIIENLESRLEDVPPEKRVEWLIGRLNAIIEPNQGDAAIELGRTHDPRAFQPLVRALKSSNFFTKISAAQGLGILGDTRAVEPLLARLGDQEGQGWMIDALGELRDPRALEPLLKLLPTSERADDIARALGKIGDPRAVEPLIGLLTHTVGRTRFYAAAGLGNIGDPRAIGSLTKALDDSDCLEGRNCVLIVPVSEMAAHMLAKLGAEDALIAALQNKKPNVREAAAGELGRLRSVKAVPALITVTGDADAFARDAAVEALGSIGDARARTALEKATQDPIPLVARRAAKALKQFSATSRPEGQVTPASQPDR